MIDPEESSRAAPAARREQTFATAVVLMLVTAAVALTWSHVKLLSQDEIFVLQTDSVSSVRELIRIQRAVPISLDPLTYHLLAHGFTKLLGPTALALRLPSMLGFLLMQMCMFFAARRIAGPRAALVATAFPALTATLFYAPEARPYGLLLGLYALTFLAWQTATRRGREAPRTGALVLLVVAIALTLNAHYFGILLLAPLGVAELVRTVSRRRLDLPVIAAIVIGAAGIVFALPFEHAAAEFKKHYYNAGAISVHAVSQAYRSLFVNYTMQPTAVQRVEDVLLVVFACVLIAVCVRRLRSESAALPTGELAFLVTLAALPLIGVLLAVFVTHSIEVRYVLSAIIAISIFVAIAVRPWAQRLSTKTLGALLAVGILSFGVIRIRGEQAKTVEERAEMSLSPELKARLLATPDSRLYIQDMGHFEVDSYYQPDPEVRSRMVLLYSRAEELRYDFHDTASLTAEHMRHFTGFTIVPYEELNAMPGEHLLVLYHSGWDWTDQALAADHAQVTPLGPALGGDAVSVCSSGPACDNRSR